MIDKIAVGRRKTSIARVVIRNGNGNITVNGKDIKEYFPTQFDYLKAIEPIKAVNADNQFDFMVNVKGGGTTGQVGAIQLGIARALVLMNPDYRAELRKNGYLTRDPRMVERKKYGQPKARKRFQFSKR